MAAAVVPSAKLMLTPGPRRLKNKEVLDVLQRFRDLGLESSPSVQTEPQSGQLFLYDRAVVKHFRRDVHEWKKKRCLIVKPDSVQQAAACRQC